MMSPVLRFVGGWSPADPSCAIAVPTSSAAAVDRAHGPDGDDQDRTSPYTGLDRGSSPRGLVRRRVEAGQRVAGSRAPLTTAAATSPRFTLVLRDCRRSAAKAASMSTLFRSARAPFACSIPMRLF